LDLAARRGSSLAGSRRTVGVAEIEKAGQRVGVRRRRFRIARRLELLGRRQEQFLDDEARHLVDAGARLWGKRGQLEVEPLELRSSDSLEPLTERDDCRYGPARSQPRAEALDLLGDDGFGVRDLAGPARKVLADRRLQIVDVVEEDLLDLSRRR